jgi:hypothetical protein
MTGFVSNSLFRAWFSKLFHSVISLRVSTTLKHILNHFAIKIKLRGIIQLLGEKEGNISLFLTLRKRE